MERVARGFSLFMNWFNGIAAPVCGLWMMASICPFMPLNWGGFMPLSVFDGFPFHEVFFTSFFWPGLALMLVNGVPNIVSLVLRVRGDVRGSYVWSIAAGVLLVAWTGVEMVFIPNGASVFYMALGVLQVAAGVVAHRSAA